MIANTVSTQKYRKKLQPHSKVLAYFVLKLFPLTASHLTQTIANRKKETSQTIKTGMPPGELVYIGKEKKETPVHVTVIDYDESNFSERKITKIEDAFPYKDTNTSTWINIDGLHHTEIVKQIGKAYNVHSLFLEDIVNTNQRPKLEEGKENIFIVFKMLEYNGQNKSVNVEQISLVLGKNYVLSFQENIGDIFDSVRARLRNPDSRIRKYGSDYLVYALMDKVIDNYFLIMEQIGEEVESLESKSEKIQSTKFIQQISQLKKEIMILRRTIWPLREVINDLLRSEVKEIKPETLLFFRDLYDHTVQVMDAIEMYRDSLVSALDVNFSLVNLKMNDVIKVLTIISTIFIPLTFIVGVYGMNFNYMPELGWRYGYFLVLLLMSAVAVGMIYYFKKKKWF